MADDPGDITRLVQAAAQGESIAGNALYEMICDELRKIAKARLSDEAANSVGTTELIDDAYQKVVGKISIENRTHFYRIAARAMRQILIDRARKRKRRIENQHTVSAVDPDELSDKHFREVSEFIQLDDLLEQFRELDPRAAEVIQLRFFGGYTVQQTAEILDISTSTVNNDWNAARAWLLRGLSDGS